VSDGGPTLKTERLLLRRWNASDREPFAALNADPEVMRYFRQPLDRSASDQFVDRIETGFEKNGFDLWAVEESSTRTFLGFTGLVRQTFEAHFTPAVEIGWRFCRAAWGHGFATEAARGALRFGFEDAGLEEIVSMTTRTNERSRAVMERIGMTYDPADDFEYVNTPIGHPLRPSVLYRLSRARWNELSPSA
jgi:RimJ/RimL family protein N-acetyltransferase